MNLRRSLVILIVCFAGSQALAATPIELKANDTISRTLPSGKTRTYTIKTVEKVPGKVGRLITGTFSFNYPGACSGDFAGFYLTTVQPQAQRIEIYGSATDSSSSGITLPQARGWLKGTTMTLTPGGVPDVVATLTTSDPTGNSVESQSAYEVN